MEDYPEINHTRDVKKLWETFPGLTAEKTVQIERIMAEALSGCKIKSRVTASGMLGILRDGYVKYFRELPQNADFVASGTVNQRDTIDLRWHSGKPVYGFAEPLEAGNQSAAKYGAVEITWQDSVKERTKVTFGDSLTEWDSIAEAVPFYKPTYLGASPLFALEWQSAADVRRQIACRQFDYIETVFSGSRSMDQIEGLVIYPADQNTTLLPELEAALKRHGVQYRVEESEEDE